MNVPACRSRDFGAKLFAGAVVSITLLLPLLFLLPSIGSTRSPARRTQTLNNLRNVGIAAQAYANTHFGSIPVGGVPDDVLPEWSWQTQLLPYLEQDARYRKVDFTRPWNSPENAKVLSETLAIYCSARESNRQPVDGFGITHFTGNSRVFRPREPITVDKIAEQDGTTSTILMGEIGAAFPPWARPGNVRDPSRGLGGGPDQFGNSWHDPCAIMFVGGNARHLSPDLAPHVLELLADPDNGVPRDDEF